MTPLNVISPHRDDAAFSLATSLSALAGWGVPVRVISCFTITDYAPYAGAAGVEAVSQLRAHEDRVFAERLNLAEPVVDLERADAPVRLQRSFTRVCTGGRFSVEDQDEVDEVSRVLVRAAPAGSLILPLGVGNHIDHRIANAAGFRAAKERVAALYEELPYSMSACSSDILRKVREVEKRLDSELLPAHLLTAENPNGKYHLISAYQSQLPHNELMQIAAYQPYGQNCERLWITPDLAQRWLAIGLPLTVMPREAYSRLRAGASKTLSMAQSLACRGGQLRRRLIGLASKGQRRDACSTD